MATTLETDSTTTESDSNGKHSIPMLRREKFNLPVPVQTSIPMVRVEGEKVLPVELSALLEDDCDWADGPALGTYKDLVALENEADKATKRKAELLVEIATRRLWKTALTEKGKQRYRNLDEYLSLRWRRHKSWINQQKNWLSVNEVTDRLGIERINPHDTQAFSAKKTKIAGGVEVVLREAIAAGTLDYDSLKGIIQRRNDFADGRVKYKAPNQEQFRLDVEQAERLATKWDGRGVPADSFTEIGDPDKLVEAVVARGTMVAADKLPEHYTGAELVALVERLLPIADQLLKAAAAPAATKRRVSLQKQLEKAKKEEEAALNGTLVPTDGAGGTEAPAKGKGNAAAGLSTVQTAAHLSTPTPTLADAAEAIEDEAQVLETLEDFVVEARRMVEAAQERLDQEWPQHSTEAEKLAALVGKLFSEVSDLHDKCQERIKLPAYPPNKPR